MKNDETRMTKETRNPNDETRKPAASPPLHKGGLGGWSSADGVHRGKAPAATGGLSAGAFFCPKGRHCNSRGQSEAPPPVGGAMNGFLKAESLAQASVRPFQGQGRDARRIPASPRLSVSASWRLGGR